MINFILRSIGGNNCSEKTLRMRCGIFSGILGIAVNLLLFAAKFFAGTVSNSIAIRADAFNNLSDAASCCITVFGFRLANRPADKEHPFGHGRLEYICSMVVTFLILIMGYELVSSSVSKILNPESVIFSYASAIILIVSIFGKLFLALFNRSLGKKIKSPALEASAADSFGDTASTLVTLIALILSKYTDLPLDGYFGLGVAIFIFIAGIRLFKESSDPLLGLPPEEDFIKLLEKKITSYEGVEGIHDLIVHDYGPGKRFASVHVEVDANCDILETHDTIDLIEQDILNETDLHLVIHLDPLIVNDERINELKSITLDAIREIDPVLTMHDFRVVEGPTHINLIFDLVIPFKYKYSDKEIRNMIDDKLHIINESFCTVISVEHNYV